MAGTEILSKIGVGSGLNTTELIEALVDADSIAQKEALDKSEESYKAKISALSTIKSNLSDFKDIIGQIQTSESYGFKGSSSDATIATITASGDDADATINSSMTVTTLATPHSLTGPSYSATTSTVGSGTLTINFGTWSADPTSGGGQTLTSNGQSQIQITTTATTTLQQLRDKINNAATDSDSDGTKDVLASIIYDGSNYMLMLKSESGASNEMKVAATSNLATTSGGIGYDYNTTTSNMSQRVSGVNAAITVDGISMTRSSNNITDLFDGFTIQLKKTSSSAISLISEVDLDTIQTLVDSYVMTYNEVHESLTIMGQNDETDEDNVGALNGDSTLRMIQKELREMSSTAISGYENGPYYMANLGVKTERDGSLTFDSTELKKQFLYDPGAVKAFFSNQLKTDDSNISVTSYDFVNTLPGTYAFATDGSNTHSIGGVSATKDGTTYAVSTGSPKGITLTVADGTTSGNIFYGKSFLNLVTDKLDDFLSFNAVLDQRIQNQTENLSTLAEKRRSFEDRVEQLTARYARQYSAMESSVAQFQETGNMLTAMLESQKD